MCLTLVHKISKFQLATLRSTVFGNGFNYLKCNIHIFKN